MCCLWRKFGAGLKRFFLICLFLILSSCVKQILCRTLKPLHNRLPPSAKRSHADVCILLQYRLMRHFYDKLYLQCPNL